MRLLLKTRLSWMHGLLPNNDVLNQYDVVEGGPLRGFTLF